MKRIKRFKPERFALLGFMLMFSTLPLASQKSTEKSGENAKNNSLQIYLGYHFSKSQDLVFSPMIYNGASANVFGLGFKRTLKHGLFQFDFAYDKIGVTPEILLSSPVLRGERASSEVTQLSLQFSYAMELIEKEKMRLYLGGLFSAKYHETIYIFGLGDQEGYFFENSISPWLMVTYQVHERNHLWANLNIPLLSFIARPPYAIVDNRSIQGENGIEYLYKRGAFASLGDYQSVNFSLGIRQELSAPIDVFFRYQLNYWRFKKPKKISVLKNNFDIGFSFNF